MDYTIKNIADLAGISTRTLRYYDKIGLLEPRAVNEAGYRVYGEKEVDALQQILFYKRLGLGLSEIKKNIHAPDFDKTAVLEEQLSKLRCRQKELELLIKNVEKTIKKEKGLIKMTNEEKFVGLKKQMVEENEKRYGKEIRDRYGDAEVEKSNAKMLNLSEEGYQQMTELAEKIKKQLAQAVSENTDPESAEGEEIVQLHKQWLMFSWTKYDKTAHKNLAEMYISDERFKAYYDEFQEGCAAFLHRAINLHVDA